MINTLKKAWYKWCIACARQRDDELEKLYRYEKIRNANEIRELFHKLENVELQSRRASVRWRPL